MSCTDCDRCREAAWRQEVTSLLTEMRDQLRLINQATHLEFWTVVEGIPRRVEMLTLKDNQQVVLSVAPVSARGNPAKVDGKPVWSVSDDAVLVLAVSEDGLSATVTAVGPVGGAQVRVDADADLGAGTKPLTGLLDVAVVAGDAASLGVTAGTPTDVEAPAVAAVG